MGRILIDIPADQVAELAALVALERRSRAAVIREAISAYIAQRKRAVGSDVFGVWKDKPVDGLAYQDKLRGEW